tara:strand:- start:410 stop:676 length:267 start_codon:yes stop_codon:yes gene_type:complete
MERILKPWAWRRLVPLRAVTRTKLRIIEYFFIDAGREYRPRINSPPELVQPNKMARKEHSLCKEKGFNSSSRYCFYWSKITMYNLPLL